MLTPYFWYQDAVIPDFDLFVLVIVLRRWLVQGPGA